MADFFGFIPMIAQFAQSTLGQYSQLGSSAVSADTKAAQLRMREADAFMRSSIEAANARAVGRAKVGAQEAAIGASGVQIGTGSAGAVVADTAATAEYETQVAKTNLLREAWGLREEAIQQEALAKAAREQQEKMKDVFLGIGRKPGVFGALTGFDPVAKSLKKRWGV